MSDLIEKLSKVEDDAEYEAYYAYMLSDLRKAGVPHPEKSARSAADIMFRRVETVPLSHLLSSLHYV